MIKLYIEENIDSNTLLKKVMNLNNVKNYEVINNEYGKPYLNNNELYFNISNKDNITVLLLSDKECGIDIESIKYNEKIINRYFNDLEKNKIYNSKYKANMFTKIWVKKEAYIKMLGIGLSYGLKNVDTLKNKYKIIRYKDYYIGYCLKD